jgi:membrane-associated phospholipid phosphatase
MRPNSEQEARGDEWMGEWLESLVPWGIDAIVWVQSFSNDWLDAIFKFFTFLGYEEFYLVLLPFVYWCADKQIGSALAFVSLLSAWANSVIKYVFKIPRPADPRISVPLPETSPSFLSGHAQGAVANWGYLAVKVRDRRLRSVAVLIIVAIGVSRIVLGVHYPQDVIGGWLVGLFLLAVYAWASPAVDEWVVRQSMPVQVAMAVAVPVLLVFLHPADWEGRYPAEGAITPMGVLAGIGMGLTMERSWVRFRAEGAWWRRGLRFLVGAVVVALFYYGPKQFFPEEMAYGLEVTLRLVHYAVVGWVAVLLAPWLFVRLGLAEKDA